MKNNTTLLYVLGGMVLGIIVTTSYAQLTSYGWYGRERAFRGGEVEYKSGMMMHQMPDGTMMGGMGGGMDMGQMMSGMMSGLNGKTGDAFDKAFLSEMIVHHEGAVVMAQAVLKNSKRPELLKLANDIIAAQTGEISKMKQWQTAWFGVSK